MNEITKLNNVLPNYPEKTRVRIRKWFFSLSKPKWIAGPFVTNRAMRRGSK